MKNKNSQTKADEFSNILTTSKRRLIKLESNKGKERYTSVFRNFLEANNIHHYSRFTDKGPSIAGRVIRTIRILLRKPIFEKGDANWLSELPSVIKKFNNKIHISIKLTPIQVGKKINEKLVHNNLPDKRIKFNPKFKLGQLDRTGDIKRVFSKGDSTKYSYTLYTITEINHDTTPSYRLNYLPVR